MRVAERVVVCVEKLYAMRDIVRGFVRLESLCWFVSAEFLGKKITPAFAGAFVGLRLLSSLSTVS